MLHRLFPTRTIEPPVEQEANQLELELGREAAVQVIREQIARADRERRRRLYRLHDEIARRGPLANAPA